MSLFRGYGNEFGEALIGQEVLRPGRWFGSGEKSVASSPAAAEVALHSATEARHADRLSTQHGLLGIGGEHAVHVGRRAADVYRDHAAW